MIFLTSSTTNSTCASSRRVVIVLVPVRAHGLSQPIELVLQGRDGVDDEIADLHRQ